MIVKRVLNVPHLSDDVVVRRVLDVPFIISITGAPFENVIKITFEDLEQVKITG